MNDLKDHNSEKLRLKLTAELEGRFTTETLKEVLENFENDSYLNVTYRNGDTREPPVLIINGFLKREQL